jgi:CheY-like chemotaxis protein
MLISVLAPLGFILDQAASGAECLEVVPIFKPDVIFMDLAMPGIDGWETIRRVRALPGVAVMPHVAIISANAFDKGLDNDAAISMDDFFVKPVRVSDLFDWIQRRLGLEWSYGAPASAPRLTETSPDVTVPTKWLEALAAQISLGYIRGVQGVLSELLQTMPEHARFVAQMRQLVAEFKLDTMSQIVQELLDANPTD